VVDAGKPDFFGSSGTIVRQRAEMIGKPGRKHIFFGMSAIRVREGIAGVDNEREGRCFGLFGCCSGQLSPAGLGGP